jgi:hypothetical protein
MVLNYLQDSYLLFPVTSKPARSAAVEISAEEKQPEREARHSPPYSAEV